MAMSRRDFDELAESLKTLKRDLKQAESDNEISLAVEAHVRRIAQLCRRHNEKFQFGKFYDVVNE